MNGVIENYGQDPDALACLANYFDIQTANRDFSDATLNKAIDASAWTWSHFDAIDKVDQTNACRIFSHLIATSREPAVKKEIRERLVRQIFQSSLVDTAIAKVSIFLTPAHALNLVSEENARQCELIVKMSLVFKEMLPQGSEGKLDHLDQLIAVALGQENAMKEQATRIRALLHPLSAIPVMPSTCGAEAAVIPILQPGKKNGLAILAKRLAACKISSPKLSDLDEGQFCHIDTDQEPVIDVNKKAKLEALTQMLEKALLKHAPALFSDYNGPMKEPFLAALKAALPRLADFLFTNDPRNLVEKEKRLFERALTAARDFCQLFVQVRRENSNASIEQIIDKMLIHNKIDPNTFAEKRWEFIEERMRDLLESQAEYLPRPDGLKEFMQTVATIAGFLLFEEYVSPVWIQKVLGRFLTGSFTLNPVASTAVGPPVALFDASDEQFSKRIGELINQLINTIAITCSNSSIKANVISGISSFFKAEIGKGIQQSMNKLLNSEVSMTPFLALYHLVMTEEDSALSMLERQEEIMRRIKTAMQNDAIAKRIPSGWELILKNALALIFSGMENEKALKFFAYYLLKAVAVK